MYGPYWQYQQRAEPITAALDQTPDLAAPVYPDWLPPLSPLASLAPAFFFAFAAPQIDQTPLTWAPHYPDQIWVSGVPAHRQPLALSFDPAPHPFEGVQWLGQYPDRVFRTTLSAAHYPAAVYIPMFGDPSTGKITLVFWGAQDTIVPFSAADPTVVLFDLSGVTIVRFD